LERVGEDRAVVEGGLGEGARFGEGFGCGLWEVPEVAPCSAGVEDDFGVVGEVELRIEVSQTGKLKRGG
jgi:hypothetical protein